MRKQAGWVAAVVLVLALIPGDGVASAAPLVPPPSSPTPSQCLAAFDNVADDYVGEGWPAALVATADDWRRGREVRLLCGDELSGVVHTAHPEASGTGHPVTALEEDAFVACFVAAIQGGASAPDAKSPGRTRYTYYYTVPAGDLVPSGLTVSATVITDDVRGTVYTMFAGISSHDWVGCARGRSRGTA